MASKECPPAKQGRPQQIGRRAMATLPMKPRQGTSASLLGDGEGKEKGDGQRKQKQKAEMEGLIIWKIVWCCLCGGGRIRSLAAHPVRVLRRLRLRVSADAEKGVTTRWQSLAEVLLRRGMAKRGLAFPLCSRGEKKRRTAHCCGRRSCLASASNRKREFWQTVESDGSARRRSKMWWIPNELKDHTE